MKWAKYANYADFADYVDYADYADYAKYAESKLGQPCLPNQTKPNLANQAYQTKPKLLGKAVDAWVRSAFGNVLIPRQTHNIIKDLFSNQGSAST